MQPHHGSGGDHLIRVCLLQAGYVLPDRSAKKLDVLRKVAQIAMTTGGQPETDVGAIEAHMPGRGSEGAGNEAPEGRLPGPRGTDYSKDFPGVDGEGQPAQRRRVGAWRHEGHLLDRELPIWAWQFHWLSRLRRRRHDLAKATVAQTHAADCLPRADRPLDRAETPAQQDGSCENHRGADIVQNHQPGCACHDDDLSEKSDEACESLDCRATHRGGELSLLRVGLVMVQEAGHARQHSHRADCFDIAQQGLEPVLALCPHGARAGEGFAGHHFIEHRKPEQDNRRQKADRTEKRMHQDHRENEDRRPRKIEQSGAGGAAEEGAEAANVAPGLRRRSRITAQGRLHCCNKNRGLQALIEPDPNAGEHRAAQGLQDGMDGQRNDDDQGQHHERLDTAARKDVVIDMQEVEGNRQRQQVHEEAEHKDHEQRSFAKIERALDVGSSTALQAGVGQGRVTEVALGGRKQPDLATTKCALDLGTGAPLHLREDRQRFLSEGA